MTTAVASAERQSAATRLMVFTGTRADFGLLRPVISALAEHDRFELSIVAGGSHFSRAHGHTVDEISDAGFSVDWRIELDMSIDSAAHIARLTAETLASVSNAIPTLSPDLGLVLGDRYEALAFASACLLNRIPLAHIHGGEVTEGAIDDAIRNAITQMASLHFVAAEPFARRVIEMGAHADHVFVVGAPGLDTVKQVISELDDPRLAVEAKTGPIGGSGPLFLVTVHPETRSAEDPGVVMQRILDALLSVDGSILLVSAPNADWGRNSIANVISRTRDLDPDRVRVAASLGHRAYIAAMLAADVVVGNSSSGVIEAPFTGTPSVNVGDRQRGRPMATSTFQTSTRPSDIDEAIAAALAHGKVSRASTTVYGAGNAGTQIRDRLLEYFES